MRPTLRTVQPVPAGSVFAGFRFPPDVIVLAVRWYLRFGLSYRGTPEGLYGRRKMTHYLRRQGHEVAFCTVDRLMRDLGMNGIRRGRGVRTTSPPRAQTVPRT